MLTDKPDCPKPVRYARLFRNGRNQAVRIPREFELAADEVIIFRQDDRLLLEPVSRDRSRKEFAVVRKEIAAVREQVAALAERVARLEGVILGPRDFARDTGTGNAT